MILLEHTGAFTLACVAAADEVFRERGLLRHNWQKDSLGVLAAGPDRG